MNKGKSTGSDNIPAEVFIHCGDLLVNLLLQILNSIKNSDVIPEQWNRVVISTIYKNKGRKKELVNHRGIFLTQVISKIYEKLNKTSVSEYIEKISKIQSGSRPNRSCCDQLFIVRSYIDHSVYIRSPIYLTLYDFRQCFDSLWLQDSIVSLWNLGIRNKILYNIYELNKKVCIKVKTPIGSTERCEKENLVKQGTVLGPICFSANIAEVDEEEIEEGGVSVGNAVMKTLTHVDDILNMNKSIRDVISSHDAVEWFTKKKRLELSETKCYIIPVNVKPTSPVPVLLVNGEEIKEKEKVTYLGDVINKRGNNTDLVEDRVKRGKEVIIRAMSICDKSMGSYSVEILMVLYRSLFLSVVLFNCQAWSKITTNNIHKLRTVQLKYLKSSMHTPTSTTDVICYRELGVLPIEYEIDIRRLTFLHHIITLDEHDPVRVVYQQQSRFEYEENWHNDIKERLERYNIGESEEEINDMKKEKWKRLVKGKVEDYAV